MRLIVVVATFLISSLAVANSYWGAWELQGVEKVGRRYDMVRNNWDNLPAPTTVVFEPFRSSKADTLARWNYEISFYKAGAINLECITKEEELSCSNHGQRFHVRRLEDGKLQFSDIHIDTGERYPTFYEQEHLADRDKGYREKLSLSIDLYLQILHKLPAGTSVGEFLDSAVGKALAE